MNISKIEKSSKKIPWLAGLFGVQLVFAVVLFNVQNRQPSAYNEPLLTFDRTALDRIEIASPDGKITLQKKDSHWQTGEGLPVADSRMDDLLKQFTDLRSGWAVATTDEAAKRFEVTDEKFKRKIRLMQGDKEVDALVVGTSPSFRQSHVRKPGSENIFAVKLDEFSLPTDQDSWLDTQLLQPKGDIVAVQFGNRKVEKVAGQWPAATPASVAAAAVPPAEKAAGNQQADAATATATDADTNTAAPAVASTEAKFDTAAFAKALAEVAVLGVATTQAELDAPVTSDAKNQEQNQVLKIQWKVTTSEGDYEYQLLSKNDQYYIRRGDKDHTFRLSKVQYDALAKIQDLRQS